MRPCPSQLHRAVVSCLAVLALSAVLPRRGQGQEPSDSLRAEITRLAAQVDTLRDALARLESDGAAGAEEEDALAQLRAAAASAAAGDGTSSSQAPDEQDFVGRERSLQALNPEISVNADMFGQIAEGDARHDNFFAREFEISLISNLDPFSRAKIFVSRHAPGGELEPFPEAGEDAHGGEFSVEEGYVEWVGLPAGLSLKLGRFQQQFGQLNRWHSHALPWQTRSLAHLAYVGEEPLAQTGASVHWLIPLGGGGGTYEVTAEVTRSENETLFGESDRPSVLGHVNGFWTLSPSVDLDLGLSWLNGSYQDASSFFDRDLFGAEMALSWRPPQQALYRGFTLRGGVMALDGLRSAGVAPTPAPTDRRAWGYWGAGELRLSRRWLIGARADRAESPLDPSERVWLVAPTLTWWQSEFVRIRAEYDLLGREAGGSDGRFMLQVTFAMGPHKHEFY